MANEKRLIDANALLEKAYLTHPATMVNPYGGDYVVSVEHIENAPTVDAVEVVRCAKCKHCKKYRNRLDPMLNHQLCVRMDKYAFGVEEDDFCSYGERRTDG